MLEYNQATSELQLLPKNFRQSAVYKFSLSMKIDQAWVYQGNKMPEEIEASTLASFKLLLKTAIHYLKLLIPCRVVEGWSFSCSTHWVRGGYTMDGSSSGHRAKIQNIDRQLFILIFTPTGKFRVSN